MKVVHAADIHLDSPLVGLSRYEGAPVERIREATRRAFDNLIALCVDEQASLLLLAGDLYDGSWKDYSTGLYFSARMSRLREAGVRVAWIRGNHDASSQIVRRLEPGDNVRELSIKRAETVIYEDLGLAVHGQGFASREVRDNIALAYPEPLPGLVNIGLLHTSVTGRPGHEPYAPCKLEELISKGYDYWALGHVHAREELCREPWVVFPGNLQGRHVRETGAKGAMLIEIEAGGVRAVSPVVLDVVRFARLAVDASDCDHAEDVLDRARIAFERAAVAADGRLVAARVEIGGAGRAHDELGLEPERFIAELRRLATDCGDVWLENVSIQTAPAVDLAELRDRDDPLGQVFRELDRLRADPSALTELVGAALGDFKPKLAELGSGADGAGPGDFGAALDDVERLLLPRLLARGRAP